jgi:ubiquinol-cytochrome c reductase subunit 8
MAANRQSLFAGAANAAVFNTYRRSRGQVLYFVPPFIAAYFLMDWAEKRYV